MTILQYFTNLVWGLISLSFKDVKVTPDCQRHFNVLKRIIYPNFRIKNWILGPENIPLEGAIQTNTDTLKSFIIFSQNLSLTKIWNEETIPIKDFLLFDENL